MMDLLGSPILLGCVEQISIYFPAVIVLIRSENKSFTKSFTVELSKLKLTCLTWPTRRTNDGLFIKVLSLASWERFFGQSSPICWINKKGLPKNKTPTKSTINEILIIRKHFQHFELYHQSFRSQKVYFHLKTRKHVRNTIVFQRRWRAYR